MKYFASPESSSACKRSSGVPLVASMCEALQAFLPYIQTIGCAPVVMTNGIAFSFSVQDSPACLLLWHSAQCRLKLTGGAG